MPLVPKAVLRRKRRRRRFAKLRAPELSIKQILRWADSYHERAGRWPKSHSGRIAGSLGESWRKVDAALRHGLRGLPGKSSLANLLLEMRGARHRLARPRLSETEILAWADSYHRRNGSWPTAKSGLIGNAAGDTWTAIHMALKKGSRGLPGGSSLPRLLAEKREVRNDWNRLKLSAHRVLSWADAHHRRTGKWPGIQSGSILEAPGETWSKVDTALKKGHRGLSGGTSLARLLAHHRGARSIATTPHLTIQTILAWADAHYRRTGSWPAIASGPIYGAKGETWNAVESALRSGCRGLQGGSTLARLLQQYRGSQNHMCLPRLSENLILRWAGIHHAKTGGWPNARSGSISAAPGERWDLIDDYLSKGQRGLPGCTTLARLLATRRGVRSLRHQPPLTRKQILHWADLHFRRTGKWPSAGSGPVHDAPEENWYAIYYALRDGRRGLSPGQTLTQLLANERDARHHEKLPPLFENRIRKWASAHYRRTGHWPRANSGPIVGGNGETWKSVDNALRYGKRGLSSRSSLFKLIAQVS